MPEVRPSVRPAAANASLRRAWLFRSVLLLAVIAWTTAWYWETVSSMAGIWWRSDTFAHGMVVYPISLWLIWRKRAQLVSLECSPSFLGLLALLLASFGWMLGELGGVQAARQLGFVVMVACAVWAVLGTSFARAISFALAFTLLAVPIGDFLLPTMMDHTADFTIGALRLTGIPVYREGNSFVIPSGSWSVVEACSGLRYLIASITLGVLYSYLTYRSLVRRMVFVAAAVIVPIVANWIRAYMIVMIGHISGMKYAVGVDHLIYGWLFFGVVMLALFWSGSRWREDLVPQPVHALHEPARRSEIQLSTLVMALLSATAVAAAPTYVRTLESYGPSADVAIAAPTPKNGWKSIASDANTFRPHYVGARRSVDYAYEKGGRVVTLFIGYYAQEHQGSELISFGNAIIAPNDRSWHRLSETRVHGAESGIEAIETHLRSGAGDLTTWHWYWAGERWVVRPELVKTLQAFDRLFRKGDDAAVVVLRTDSGKGAGNAASLLQEFASDMGSSIASTLRESRVARRTAGMASQSSAH